MRTANRKLLLQEVIWTRPEDARLSILRGTGSIDTCCVSQFPENPGCPIYIGVWVIIACARAYGKVVVILEKNYNTIIFLYVYF